MNQAKSFACQTQAHEHSLHCWCRPIYVKANNSELLYHRDDLGRAFELGLDLVRAIEMLGLR